MTYLPFRPRGLTWVCKVMIGYSDKLSGESWMSGQEAEELDCDFLTRLP